MLASPCQQPKPGYIDPSSQTLEEIALFYGPHKILPKIGPAHPANRLQTLCVVVFADGAVADEARAAGADLVASADETGQVGPCVACCCQVLRSVSQWSAGTSQVEESIHKAYISLIEKAEHFVYIEIIVPEKKDSHGCTLSTKKKPSSGHENRV
ncbi:unnamed protein product [Lactuca saligna]|uniref:Uncharacterized protein n=1 Tax=Lactuca saligna TaxID=75948 RepID=A0AA36DZE8_LACSI|nr:unnamed protein product [Lactuca saligna]